MTPQALDIAIAIIILLSTIVSYCRGLVKEFTTMAAVVIAGMTAFKEGHVLIPEFNKWMKVPPEGSAEKAEKVMGILSPEMVAKIMAYGGTFIFIFLVITLIGFFISRSVKEVGFSVVDKLLGAAFGFLRGFLLVFILYVPCTYLIDHSKFPDWAKNSESVPILQSTLDWANKTFDLDKKIEDHGNGISIKLDKVDPDSIGSDTTPAEQDLKSEIKNEEKEIQKSPPPEVDPGRQVFTPADQVPPPSDEKP